jgi:hypothetical protein
MALLLIATTIMLWFWAMLGRPDPLERPWQGHVPLYR